MMRTHVHETDTLGMISDQPLQIVTLVLVAKTTKNAEQDSKKKKGVRVIKKIAYTVHSFLACTVT